MNLSATACFGRAALGVGREPRVRHNRSKRERTDEGGDRELAGVAGLPFRWLRRLSDGLVVQLGLLGRGHPESEDFDPTPPSARAYTARVASRDAADLQAAIDHHLAVRSPMPAAAIEPPRAANWPRLGKFDQPEPSPIGRDE